jgi:hypothetical protein
MGSSWDQPKWRREGRTGSGPDAPQYAKLRNRNAVRSGNDSKVGSPGLIARLFGKGKGKGSK